MKYYLVLVIFIFLTTTCLPMSAERQACQSENGLHPHPYDCAKFLQCGASGDSVVKSCGPNTHFNPSLSVCDWPNAANVCSTSASKASHFYYGVLSKETTDMDWPEEKEETYDVHVTTNAAQKTQTFTIDLNSSDI